ncbi:hypothetical protein D8M21_06200 [Kocuria sp. HSID16901]|nr:hypothetical protein D8M21_06200 [Kocuria sp. HSID16901]
MTTLHHVLRKGGEPHIFTDQFRIGHIGSRAVNHVQHALIHQLGDGPAYRCSAHAVRFLELPLGGNGLVKSETGQDITPERRREFAIFGPRRGIARLLDHSNRPPIVVRTKDTLPPKNIEIGTYL